MKHKYNLVYIPTSKNQEITTLARQFSTYADQYLLGNQALPHVTLCQFEAQEQDLEKIWLRAEKLIPVKSISLTFDSVSVINKNNFFWVSLIPDHATELHELHNTARSVLEIKHQVWFDPHLTLFNSTSDIFSAAVENFKASFTHLSDNCILALGKSGFAGQFKEIIYRAQLD
jgi:2'-5' RNA ligase